MPAGLGLACIALCSADWLANQVPTPCSPSLSLLASVLHPGWRFLLLAVSVASPRTLPYLVWACETDSAVPFLPLAHHAFFIGYFAVSGFTSEAAYGLEISLYHCPVCGCVCQMLKLTLSLLVIVFVCPLILPAASLSVLVFALTSSATLQCWALLLQTPVGLGLACITFVMPIGL